MKSILPLMVMIILVLGGLGAAGINYNEINDVKLNLHMSFSEPITTDETSEFIEISIKDTHQYIMSSGKPKLPEVLKKIELEFGVKNIRLDVKVNNVQETTISKYIEPAPITIPLSMEIDDQPLEKLDEEIYQSNEPYPTSWCSYTVGCGLNADMQRVTHLAIHVYPIRYKPASNTVLIADEIDISISYDEPDTNLLNTVDEYDMVIITPQVFVNDLERLVTHKNSVGVKTIIKTTEDIYNEYEGVDKPEQIKYFIKDAIETWGITYVLLVGGLKSMIYAKAMDTENYGVSGWYLPVRWSNNDYGEPGPVTDLYYADVYKAGGEFDDWDSDNDGMFAEFGFNDQLDLYQDVFIGRLACRSNEEVITVVDKIINYESTAPDEKPWFNKIIGITGDGFLDQPDLGIQWDTNGVPDGQYTLYAQSNNDEAEFGPLEIIDFSIDRSVETVLTFNHDDHLRIENFPQYPAPPMAEVLTITEGDILGNTDYEYIPGSGEAYLNNYFGYGNVRYIDGLLHIGVKTYNPKLYGNSSDIHVWIKNSNEETVFDEWRYDSPMYSEGDWTVGDRVLLGRGGSFYYMPENFEKVMLSSANGLLEDIPDVVEAFSEGCGFIFFSGHGSPNVWANHFPGVPGNRQNGDFDGLKVINVKLYAPFFEKPVLPMNDLTNNEKLPVAVIGGCHNSLFTVSIIPALLDLFIPMNMHTYGQPVPETFSWYMIRIPNGGAIASIGNTGYGYGIIGEDCTTGGVDNWITTEFFRQYGVENLEILGQAHALSIASYIDTFGKGDQADRKTVEQWVLLGDPSLLMGGYE